jgi:hypothetical protein
MMMQYLGFIDIRAFVFANIRFFYEWRKARRELTLWMRHAVAAPCGQTVLGLATAADSANGGKMTIRESKIRYFKYVVKL